MDKLQTRRNLVLERNKTRENKRNKWSFEKAKDTLRKHILENKDQVRFVGSHPKIHTTILDATEDLLEKFYKKSLSLEKMLADFRINLYENPENESEILKKFLKRIRM